MRLHIRLLAAAAAVALLAALAPAAATPVCTDLPRVLCGDRVVPEPRRSVTYITFNEFNDALDVLADEFPGWLEVRSIGESVGGHPLIEAELTNPDGAVPYEDRRVVYVAQSIHGNEVAGREGMIRFIEDILRDEDDPARDILETVRLVQVVPNTDGWVSGDWDRPGIGIYTRGNANGVDLNRQFPWKGWIPANRNPVSQPEAQAVVADADERKDRGEQVTGTADIHGMLQDEAAVWTMLSSGQFDLGGSVRMRAIGEAIADEVEERIGDHALFVLGELAGHAVIPHVLTSSSEFKGGLSGSGFLGDWLAQREGLDAPSVSTIELFWNQPPHAVTFVPELVQVHVDGVRAILRAMLDMAVTDLDVAATPPGPVGYLYDPVEVLGETPMRFFDDLAPYLDAPLVPLDVDDLDLDGLHAVVATTELLADRPEAAAAVRAFTEAGGTVLLTDGGLAALPLLDDGIPDGAVTTALTRIGNASFTDTEHPLAAGVRAGALHTYEPAPLGYNSEGANQAPVWRVNRETWEAGGGQTVATTGGGQTSIGERPLGAGTVRIIGGLLPPPTDQNHTPFGVASYTPTDTGYHVFLNALDAELSVTATPSN